MMRDGTRRPARLFLLLVGAGLGFFTHGDYHAAADGEADAPVCDCPTELSQVNARLTAAEEALAELSGRSPGLIAYDALGNTVGHVLTMKQGPGFAEHEVYNQVLETTFWVPEDGKISMENALFATADCTGQAYASGGSSATLIGNGSDKIYVQFPGPDLTIPIHSRFNWSPDCVTLSGAPKWVKEVKPASTPFPLPVPTPIVAK